MAEAPVHGGNARAQTVCRRRPLATTEDEDNYLRLVTLAKPDIMLDEVIQGPTAMDRAQRS